MHLVLLMMPIAPAIMVIIAMMATCLLKPPGSARIACHGFTGV